MKWVDLVMKSRPTTAGQPYRVSKRCRGWAVLSLHFDIQCSMLDVRCSFASSLSTSANAMPTTWSML